MSNDQIRFQYEFWQQTKQTPTEHQIMGRKWQWIGHTLRKPLGATERNALNRNPQGTRKGVDQEQPGKKTTERELQKAGKRWKEA
jgi:hypothetical protein